MQTIPLQNDTKKLLNTHPGEIRFTYRHEIPANCPKLKDMGLKEYFEFQKQSWKCKLCGGKILFYHYKCSVCGKGQII